MQEDSGGATLRYTVLGHVVRGGRPSALDRIIGSRLGYVAATEAMNGNTDVMVGWRPYEGGAATIDSRVSSFELATVLKLTQELLDGSHQTARERLEMMSRVQGILLL